MTSPRVRQAELARQLKVSRQAINDLVTRGIIAVAADGLIDVESAKIALAGQLHPASKTASVIQSAQAAAAPKAAPQVAPMAAPRMSYQEARTLREYSEAKRSELKYRQELGDLAPLAEVNKRLDLAIIDAREFLRAEPPRLAVQLDGLDRAAREALLRQVFDAFLKRLAEWNPQ